MTCKKESMSTNPFASMSPKKGSTTNPCFWGWPVANFLTLYNWGSDQFAQCNPQAWGSPATDHTNTPRLRHCRFEIYR
jgi:hypothetical protein